jgi:hypothetical protein
VSFSIVFRLCHWGYFSSRFLFFPTKKASKSKKYFMYEYIASPESFFYFEPAAFMRRVFLPFSLVLGLKTCATM